MFFISFLTVAEKYNAALQIAPKELGLHASYYHKLSDNQALGAEIDGKVSTKECVATVGYSFDIPGSETSVKSKPSLFYRPLTRVLLYPWISPNPSKFDQVHFEFILHFIVMTSIDYLHPTLYSI